MEFEDVLEALGLADDARSTRAAQLQRWQRFGDAPTRLEQESEQFQGTWRMEWIIDRDVLPTPGTGDFLGELTQPVIPRGEGVLFRLDPPSVRGEVQPENSSFWSNGPGVLVSNARTGSSARASARPRDALTIPYHFNTDGVWTVRLRGTVSARRALATHRDEVALNMTFQVIDPVTFIAVALEQQRRSETRQRQTERHADQDRLELSRDLSDPARRAEPTPGASAAPEFPDGRLPGNINLPSEVDGDLSSSELTLYMSDLSEAVQRVTPLDYRSQQHLERHLLSRDQRRYFRISADFTPDHRDRTITIQFHATNRSSQTERLVSRAARVTPHFPPLRYDFDDLIVVMNDGERQLVSGEDLLTIHLVNEVLNTIDLVSFGFDLITLGEGAMARVLGRQARRFFLGRLSRRTARNTARRVVSRLRRQAREARLVQRAFGRGARRATQAGRNIRLMRDAVNQVVHGLFEIGFNIFKGAVRSVLEEVRRTAQPRNIEEWRARLDPNDRATARIVRRARQILVDDITEGLFDRLRISASAKDPIIRYIGSHVEGVIFAALQAVVTQEHARRFDGEQQQRLDLDNLSEVAANAAEAEYDSMIEGALDPSNAGALVRQASRLRRR